MIKDLIDMNCTLMCLIEHSNVLEITVENLIKTKVISMHPYVISMYHECREVFTIDFDYKSIDKEIYNG